jgi:hypothetical protein
MYKYRIGKKEVVFNSPEEREKGLAEAEAAGLTIELIYDHSEETGDGSFNIKDDWETDDFTTGKDLDKVFQTDAAEGADVVSETTAQDTELSLEDGSSVSIEPLEGDDLAVIEGSDPITETIKFASLPEEVKKETRFQAGIANTIAKTFVERDVFQLEDKLPGQNVSEMDKEGKLTMLTSEAINNYFASQPGETLLDNEQIDAIAFNIVNDLKQAEIAEINNKSSIAAKRLKDPDAFVATSINNSFDKMTKPQQELIVARQNLANANKIFEGEDYKQRMANAQNIIDLEEKVSVARDNYKKGATGLSDINTGKQLTRPELIQYELEGKETADYSDEIKDLIKSLPTTSEKLKSSWIGNTIEIQELNEELQNKVTLVSKPGRGDGIQREYTFEQLMKLRNAGTDLEIFDVAVGEDEQLAQSISNDMFDNYNNRRRALNIKQQALDELYLYDIDPGSVEKKGTGLLSQFEKTALKATFGDVIEDIYPQTQRDLLDVTENVFSDLGIETTEAQKKNFERTFGMQVAEGVGYFVPELAKFAVANAITGGVLGTAKTMVQTANGWKAITWANRINQLKRSGSTLNKAKGLVFDAIVEEIKFKGVTGGESATGAGAGFALGGAGFRALPFKLSPKVLSYRNQAVINPIFNKVVGGGIGGATSSEVALVVEDMYKAATTDKDLLNLLKKSFVEDADGNDVDVLERYFVNAAVFSAIGVTHMRPKDIRKISTVRNLNNQYNGKLDLENAIRKKNKAKGKIIEKEMSEVEYNNLIDKIFQTESILAVADKGYNELDLSKIREQRDDAQNWLSTDPSKRSDAFTDSAQARAVINKYDQSITRVRSVINKTLENVEESNILGNDFKYKVVDTLPEGDKGLFLPKSNEIIINLSEFKAGVTEHEINHAIINKLITSNSELAIGLRKIIEADVSAKLKGIEFKLGEEDLELSEWIDKTHADKDERGKADEYISYLTEMFNNPKYREKLIDTGVISDLKNSISTVMENFGMKRGSVADRINLNENNLNRASDILAFFDQLSNGGKKASNWRSKFDTYNLLATDIKNLELVDIPTGKKVESIEKGVEEVMKSSSMKEATEDFKNKNLAKINAEFEKMKAEGQDATSIGFNIGLKFQDIANKTMESYLRAKDLNINADTKYDIVADLMYEAIPKAVNAYVEGQRFIDYVKENNLSKEEAAVEFKNRNLRETSGTERFERLYGMAKGEVKQATITSYLLGNLTNQLIGVFKMPKYEGIFKNVSFDAQKVDKLQAEGELDIPVSEQGFVDTSSPVKNVQRTRKSAESMLGLSEKTINTVNKVVENITKKPITDIDAKSKGDIDMGPGGKVNIVMLDNNRARVTYPDGKKEIMLGARSPLNIIKKIIKKFRSEAFQKLRAPKATEAEKIKAQEEFNVYSKLTDSPPKFVKEKILKTELGLAVEKGIYEEISKDAGELGTTEYQGFIDRSFPLFKTYLSQRAINKRFPDFKEPLLGPDGKQVRAKTAAGAPLFLKKNIKLAEWRKYFTGKDSPDLQLRRTSLLEALSRELGFDRVMEITIDEGLRKQLENDQIAVNNELDNSYVALFQKAVDRGEANGGAMASKALIESSKGSGKDLKELKKQWLTIFVPGEIVDKEKLKKERPNDYELLADIISRVNGFGLVEIQKEGAKLRDQGVGDSINIEGIETNPNKTMSTRTKSERESLGESMVMFDKLASSFVTEASTSQTSEVKRLLSNMFGFTSRISPEGEPVNANEYESIIKNNKGIAETMEASPQLKEAWTKAEILLKETSLLGENAKGKKDINEDFLTTTFNRNIDAFINKFNEIQALPKLKGEGEVQAINRRIKLLDKYAKTPEGKVAIKDIQFKDALLEASLLTFGEMFNFGSKSQKAKVADLLASTLLNNDGVGFRAFSSQKYFAFTAEASLKRAKNEHLDPKQKFGVRVMDAFIKGDLSNPEAVKALTSGYNSLYGSERYQKIADSRIGAVRSLPSYKKMIAATAKPTKKDARRVKKMIDGKLTSKDLDALSRIYDITTGKSALEELMSDTAANLNASIIKAESSAFKTNAKLFKSGKMEESNNLSTKQQLDQLESKIDRKRLQITDEKTGEVRFEGDKEYKTRMEELEATSPELFLPKELAGMIERKGGVKADEEISDSKAFMEGKKRRDDLFLPSNSEDLQGLLYKVYGKGKQGEEDMAFMKEHILRPLTRAENDLSVYRMNLVVDYKTLEAKMKELGNNKAEREAVKRVEKLGYNIDQAVRVYIWNRLNEKIPGISEVEVAQLAGAVHNSERLQAYAKGIMNITKTSDKYPKPTANWFRSNVQYDLFTYATDGVRADFLAPWQANVDAMFDKQNLNKLEARFGGKYVYNLKQMLKRIERGKSRPESTNESFNKALNYVNGSVATIMFLNMRSAALQTISAANYVNWTDNNPVAIGKVIAENPAEFIRVAKKIWSSDALKDRRSGLRINVEEAEMAKAINQGGRTNLQGLWDTMVKVGFKPTQMADSFAIVTGGTPFYMNRMKTYEKQGLSKSEAENKAFEDFLDVTQEGQQSSQMDRVSNIQTGLMGRLVFSFNNTPFQMSRIQKKAALDLVNRRGSDRANASRLAYYAFMQSTLFYGLQQGFYATLMSDDDDKLTEKQQEEKYKDFEKRVDKLGKSVFQGILTGSGLPGKVVTTLYNTVDKAIEEYDKGYQGKDFFPILNQALSISPTLGSKASRLGRNWESLIYTDFTKKGREIRNTYSDFDPRNPNAKAYLSMFGTLTNIPLDRIVTKMENIQGVLDDQSSGWEKVAMTLGTPKYQLQTKEQNEADRQARIDKFYKENTPKGDRDFNAISDLNKKEQLKFMTDLDIESNKYFKIKNDEEKRINFIIRKGLEKGIDLEVEAEKYIIKKPERSAEYKELAKLTKKQQLELMTILDIGDEYFKLKDGKEEDRVNWILKKQKEKSNNNKQNSLK